MAGRRKTTDGTVGVKISQDVSGDPSMGGGRDSSLTWWRGSFVPSCTGTQAQQKGAQRWPFLERGCTCAQTHLVPLKLGRCESPGPLLRHKEMSTEGHVRGRSSTAATAFKLHRGGWWGGPSSKPEHRRWVDLRVFNLFLQSSHTSRCRGFNKHGESFQASDLRNLKLWCRPGSTATAFKKAKTVT